MILTLGGQTPADIVLFFLALPFALWAAWGDLRDMRIANRLNLGLFLAFVVVGLLVLPPGDWLLRIAFGVGALVLGFVLNMIGLMGGGDAKYIAAFTPFLFPPEIPAFLVILIFTLLAGVAVHRIAALIGPVRRIAPEWKSWERGRKFPMGFPLSGALLIYLGLRAFSLPV